MGLFISLVESSSTPTPSWPSPTPEPTVTSDLCQDLKHQSSPLTLAETVPRSAAFPFPIQKDDALNSEPDPTCNPYLAFSAVVQAGVDGIRNKIHPGDPCDINLYEASAAELANLGIKGVPSTLKESLNALEKDHAYLLDGGVFTEDVLEKYIEQKNDEWTGYLQRPTPYEYTHYYDC